MRTQSHSRDSARPRRSEGWCRAAAAPSLLAEERGEHAEHTEACKPGEGTARLPTDFARILFTLSRKGNTWRIAGCRPDADRPNPRSPFASESDLNAKGAQKDLRTAQRPREQSWISWQGPSTRYSHHFARSAAARRRSEAAGPRSYRRSRAGKTRRKAREAHRTSCRTRAH